jgi:hypothetical protein
MSDKTPQDFVETVAALRFPDRTEQRMQKLMDRNNEGSLTEDEKEELASLVEVSEELSLVRARALSILGKKPA